MGIATVTADDRSRDAPGPGVPVPLNCALAVGHVALNLYQLFLLPLILLPASSWWGLTVVPVALMSNSFWSLIHEAIHDHFHLRLRSNYFAGRFLSVFFGLELNRHYICSDFISLWRLVMEKMWSYLDLKREILTEFNLSIYKFNA